MPLKTLVFLLLFLILLSFPLKVFAARSLNISSNKGSLFGEEEMTINASASGFTNDETIYIKGAFFQDGTTNYFGKTQNGSNWIKNGETATSQKTIKIGEWDGNLISKSDFQDSGYKGEGEYMFKVGFYYLTSGGNLSSVNWSTNILSINLNEPEYTPTNTPLTPSSSSTNTPTPTKTPTSTPTPTKKPTNTPTPKKEVEVVLGAKTKNTPTPTPDNSKNEEERIAGTSSVNPTHVLFILIGGVFLVGCGILAWQKFGPLRPKRGFFDE